MHFNVQTVSCIYQINSIIAEKRRFFKDGSDGEQSCSGNDVAGAASRTKGTPREVPLVSNQHSIFYTVSVDEVESLRLAKHSTHIHCAERNLSPGLLPLTQQAMHLIIDPLGFLYIAVRHGAKAVRSSHQLVEVVADLVDLILQLKKVHVGTLFDGFAQNELSEHIRFGQAGSGAQLIQCVAFLFAHPQQVLFIHASTQNILLSRLAA